MIAQLAGYTLTKTIPDKHLVGILTGALKICGGVIRNNEGRIVSHLIDGGTSALNVLSPVSGLLEGVNTFQLYRIGKDIGGLKEGVASLQTSMAAMQAATSHIVTLASGTMLLSGLTLAVSAASFVFLNKKLSKIDKKLIDLAKDVKEIKVFLQLEERSRLVNALKDLSQIAGARGTVRTQILGDARKTLGEIHQKYRELLMESNSVNGTFAVEEYYSLTLLGNVMCSAELKMGKQATEDIAEGYSVWQESARRIANKLVLRNDAERFMNCRYGGKLKTSEIVDWLEFSHKNDKGLDWIDELRAKPSWLPDVTTKLNKTECEEIELMRKFVTRNRIYEGYKAQYEFLNERGLSPSELQAYYESLPASERVNDECHILMAD